MVHGARDLWLSPDLQLPGDGIGHGLRREPVLDPRSGPDGTLYIHFLNFQNEDEWEFPFEFDSQVMVMRSTDGGRTLAGRSPRCSWKIERVHAVERDQVADS